MQIARPVLLACFFAACGATTDKATCFDGEKNGTETDIDCGGGACGRCFDGKACTLPSDCMSALCTGGRCGGFLPGGGGGSTGGGGGGSTGGGGGSTGGGGGGSTGGGGGATGGGGGATGGGGGALGGGGGSTGGGGGSTGGGGGATGTVLLISQVQTRGEAGGNDEFVELYNPSTTLSVVFDSTWTLSVRAATSCASTEGTRYTGAGQLIGPRRHLLLTNSGGYNGSVAGDATYTTAIGDAASVVLRREQTVVDAVCLAADSATMTSLTTCTPTFLCEGTPVMNPHDNTTATNTDMAVLRVNGADTQNNAADFAAMASAPRNLAVP